jgi:flagella basal body P-ring formation protein FlgA
MREITQRKADGQKAKSGSKEAPRLLAFRIAALFGAMMLPVLSSRASGPLDRILAPVEVDVKPVKVEAPVVAAPAVAAPVVQRVPSMLTGDSLLEQLKKQLIEHYSVDGELKLELSRPWTPVPLPADDVTVTIVDFCTDRLSNSVLVRCEALSGGQKVGQWQVGLSAQLWKEVWAASARLDRGQSLDRSMLSPLKVDILRERDTLLTTDVDPSGFDVEQSVAAGRPLGKHDVTERPLIRKNQIVEAVAHRGALAISMKAQALENGVASALIKMRNLESQKIFSAQVLDENRVEVQF